jgi:hypothetical protein
MSTRNRVVVELPEGEYSNAISRGGNKHAFMADDELPEVLAAVEAAWKRGARESALRERRASDGAHTRALKLEAQL